jgi:hypothetical protein
VMSRKQDLWVSHVSHKHSNCACIFGGHSVYLLRHFIAELQESHLGVCRPVESSSWLGASCLRQQELEAS